MTVGRVIALLGLAFVVVLVFSGSASTASAIANSQLAHSAGAEDACANTEIIPTADNLATVDQATICLVNGYRADAGLAPLAENSDLDQAALAHDEDMVANQYFSHTSLNGTSFLTRIQETGYLNDANSFTVGENLAWGTETLATPAAIVLAWMNSPEHEANILNPAYTQLGMAVVLGNPAGAPGGGATYDNEFGSVTYAAPVSSPSSSAGVAHTNKKTKKQAVCKRLKNHHRRAACLAKIR